MYTVAAEEPLLKLIGIPLAMATQHPDSANKGFNSQEEVGEALLDLLPLSEGGFGCDEKMIDYEGKLTPYQQMKWVVEELIKAGLEPGEDFIITPRVPAEKLEEAERQFFVLMGVMTANKYSIDKTGNQAIRYIVHPMSESPQELLVLQRRVVKLQRLAEEELGLHGAEPPKIIPLIEEVIRHLHADKLLEGFHANVAKQLGMLYDSYRVFLGKSDAALGYGHLASSISLVVALSKIYRWGQQEGVRVYPIIGVGKPPFRGHLAPHAVDKFVMQYRGYYTVTIQTALRYDTPREDYIHTLRILRENAAADAKVLSKEEERVLAEAARIATREYLRFLIQVADIVYTVSRHVPKRRERVPTEQYGRDISPSLAFASDPSLLVNAKSTLPLPRAIRFTASMYTLGIPPALVGLGRGLEAIRKRLGEEVYELVLKLLPSLPTDVEFELRWWFPDIARSYMPSEIVKLVEEDVRIVRDVFGVEPEPAPPEYKKLMLEARGNIAAGRSAAKQIEDMGKIRGFLG
ncbi:phosphoenolpyruvate carboxylase [Pyrolobus fumarii 1A]|uniref:Phosphoenolpyruvate carboxylase n=1 Tax=Pyrolobus fumarii (strain DSM 11204 / 1A) TaxID=694429 RepID=G0EDU9_PYRF1|nr:phosphoenolpyruvate carboxylase [Pyrolobus fumarii 1A]